MCIRDSLCILCSFCVWPIGIVDFITIKQPGFLLMASLTTVSTDFVSNILKSSSKSEGVATITKSAFLYASSESKVAFIFNSHLKKTIQFHCH